MSGILIRFRVSSLTPRQARSGGFCGPGCIPSQSKESMFLPEVCVYFSCIRQKSDLHRLIVMWGVRVIEYDDTTRINFGLLAANNVGIESYAPV